MTNREKCVTIFEQSAGWFQHLRGRRTAKPNMVCEGGGTGRRARLRCVWFILGGSSPLPRTRNNPRNVDEKSMLRGFFVHKKRTGSQDYDAGIASNIDTPTGSSDLSIFDYYRLINHDANFTKYFSDEVARKAESGMPGAAGKRARPSRR